MYLPGEQDTDLLQPAHIQELIQQTRATHGLPLAEQPAQIIRSACYTFYETLAATFSQGRIFLLGDAAHLMPPFGGQGMNSGLRDAHNLCWKLGMVLQGRAAVRILASYQEERKPHVAQMILLSSLLGKIIMPTSSLAAYVRDLCFRVLNLLPPLREVFAEAKVKPQPAYKHGLLIHITGKECKQLTGQMLPQPYMLTPMGQQLLLDDILGNGFTLLRLYNDPQQAFIAIGGPSWERLGVRYLCIRAEKRLLKRQSQVPQPASNRADTKEVFVAIDHEGVLSEFLQGRQDLFVLLRPDRYILGVFRLKEKDQFEAKLLTELIKELDA